MASLLKRCIAELLGTGWLVLGGCGAAVLAAKFPSLGIGFVGVALAFGLTQLTMCYAIGPISGSHINPAVSVGLWAAGRFPGKEVLPYVISQVIGAALGALVLYLIASGKSGFDVHAGFATNGYGVHSPGNYSMLACAICEIVMTAFFVGIISLSTDKLAATGFAGLTIGLALTLIHLISIPVTNTSVNPARSEGPALFEQGIALQQLWFFWVMPLIGGIVGGLIYRYLTSQEKAAVTAVVVEEIA